MQLTMKCTSLLTLVCIVVTSFVVMLSAGCENTGIGTADEQQQKQTEQLTAEAQRQVGMPTIKNFQERKLMKQIMELRDRVDLVTYAYIVDWQGNLHYIGQCVGFGLPYSVQFTSPEKVVDLNGDRGGYVMGTVPQPDPNGLYMPEGLSATWLMMLDPSTEEVKPVYVEPQIIVSPFPLH
jgi:hypothetical protein